jgi:hypothetical protein
MVLCSSSCLSCDRSIVSSKLSSPEGAILSFLLQLPVSSCFLRYYVVYILLYCVSVLLYYFCTYYVCVVYIVLYWVVLLYRVVLSFYFFFCTRVGLLPPGANPIAVKIIIIIKVPKQWWSVPVACLVLPSVCYHCGVVVVVKYILYCILALKFSTFCHLVSKVLWMKRRNSK